jgi:hypothetical protein
METLKTKTKKIGFIAVCFNKKGNVSDDLSDPIEEKFTNFKQAEKRINKLSKIIFTKHKNINKIIFDLLPLSKNEDLSYMNSEPTIIEINR